METATLLLNMSVASSKPCICNMIQGCGGVTISHGETAFPAGRNYGAEATITCNRGYDRVGTRFITCLDTGLHVMHLVHLLSCPISDTICITLDTCR